MGNPAPPTCGSFRPLPSRLLKGPGILVLILAGAAGRHGRFRQEKGVVSGVLGELVSFSSAGLGFSPDPRPRTPSSVGAVHMLGGSKAACYPGPRQLNSVST